MQVLEEGNPSYSDSAKNDATPVWSQGWQLVHPYRNNAVNEKERD